jgi:PAS domain S-box-containing protein
MSHVDSTFVEATFMKAIVDSSDDAIYCKSLDGTILSWNRAAELIYGYTASEAIGQPMLLVVPPERHHEMQDLLRQIGRGDRVEHFETERVRKDGSRVDVSVTLSPVKDSQGRITACSVIARNIALRKKAETHLAQMEARYRGLLEAAPDAMVVVNQGGEIVLLNAQAENQFGYRRDELLGQKVTNIIPTGFAERLIADGTRSAAEALAQQIGTGIELTAKRGDRSEFPIEIMLSPLESPDGILVTAAIRDITVRKDAERHLAQMEARYRGLLEAAPDAMVVVNQGGEIVLLNAQAENQFGYRRDELLGQKVINIIPTGFAERLIADGTRSAAEALAQQIGTGIELTGRRKNGSEFPIEIMLSPLESAEGILITAAIRDIAERKRAEKQAELHTAEIAHVNTQLAEGAKELEAFAYSVSHDLRAPLRHLDGFLSLLCKSSYSSLDDSAKHYVDCTLAASKRMGQLIDDLLQFSRLGRDEIHKMPVDLNEVVEQVRKELEPETRDRNILWRLGHLPEAVADRAMLRQAIENLVANALKFTRHCAAAEIEIGCQPEPNGQLVFFVRDNGAGFDMRYYNKLFEIFQRLHGEQEFEGTGVGLAIVRRVVERHGGRVWAEGGVGAGATFYFSLPPDISRTVKGPHELEAHLVG